MEKNGAQASWFPEGQVFHDRGGVIKDERSPGHAGDEQEPDDGTGQRQEERPGATSRGTSKNGRHAPEMTRPAGESRDAPDKCCPRGKRQLPSSLPANANPLRKNRPHLHPLMRLSHESRRTTWITLGALWLVSAVYLGVQTKLVDGYLDLAGNFGLRGKAAAETPLRAAYPVFAADAQTWVRHAINLAEGDSLRLRHTAMDNAPAGREVHWNSAWAWAIAASGKLHAQVTGKNFREATEASIRWLNPLAQWLLAVALSAWTARRGGLTAGFLVGLAVLCKDRIYEGFFPSYADHHGLLTLSVLGCVLGAMFMGAGWWRRPEEGEVALLPGSPGEARSAAVFSALAGAAGMWVSAASVIPAITVAGAAGLATLLLTRRDGTDGRSQSFDAGAWRVWEEPERWRVSPSTSSSISQTTSVCGWRRTTRCTRSHGWAAPS